MSVEASKPAAEAGVELGVVDRLCHAYQNAGETRVMSMVVSFPTHEAAPSLSALCKRLDVLIRRYPILSTRLEELPLPRLVPLASVKTGADMVRGSAYALHAHEAEHSRINRLCREAHDSLVRDGDIHTGKALTIDRLHPADDAAGKTYIVFAVNHTLMDGTGLLRFVHLVLETASSTRDGVYDKESLETLSRSEDVLDILPDPSTAPSGPPPRDPPYWGMVGKGYNTFDLSVGFAFASLPPDTVKAIDSVAKAQGIRTLGPVLAAAILMAMISVTDEPKMTEGVHFGMLRSNHAAAKLPKDRFALNFFSAVGATFERPDLEAPDLWRYAERLQQASSDPGEVKGGLQRWGQLSIAPMPISQLLRMTSESDRPYKFSLAVTNLSRTSLPQGADDLVWLSGAAPQFTPILAHVIGHEAGVRLSIAYRVGHSITPDVAECAAKEWVRILEQTATAS